MRILETARSFLKEHRFQHDLQRLRTLQKGDETKARLRLRRLSAAAKASPCHRKEFVNTALEVLPGLAQNSPKRANLLTTHLLGAAKGNGILYAIQAGMHAAALMAEQAPLLSRRIIFKLDDACKKHPKADTAFIANAFGKANLPRIARASLGLFNDLITLCAGKAAQNAPRTNLFRWKAAELTPIIALNDSAATHILLTAAQPKPNESLAALRDFSEIAIEAAAILARQKGNDAELFSRLTLANLVLTPAGVEPTHQNVVTEKFMYCAPPPPPDRRDPRIPHTLVFFGPTADRTLVRNDRFIGNLPDFQQRVEQQYPDPTSYNRKYYDRIVRTAWYALVHPEEFQSPQPITVKAAPTPA